MLPHGASLLADFLRREDGPSAVEYAVMMALLMVVCMVAMAALSINASSTFNSLGNATTVSGR